MVTNLIFPVQDLDKNKFQFDRDLSNDEYNRMQLEHFNNTYGRVGDYLEGKNVSYGQYGYEIHEDRAYDIPDNDNEVEVESLLLNSNRADLTEADLFNYLDNGNKFIMIVNINPTTVDPDAESEIRYWLEDSMRVWNDEALDKKTKILSSPPRDLKIALSDGAKHTLRNCKIFEEYSDERFPLYFAVLVDKIE